MSDRPEARILLRPARDGKRELVVLDPKTNRESQTGLLCGPSQADIDATVRKVKLALERSGSWVSQVKML